ncbi:MAG: hypothetical protein ACR2J8_07680 [Thermomicrobiales bacterium]
MNNSGRKWPIAQSVLVVFVAVLTWCAGPYSALAQNDAPPSFPGVVDAPQTQAEAGMPEGGWIVVETAPGQPVDAESFRQRWGADLETAVEEIGAALPPLDGPLEIVLYGDGVALAAGVTDPVLEPGGAQPAAVGTQQGSVAAGVDSLLAMPDDAAKSALRHAVAHALVVRAGGIAVPAGFAEGNSRYVEQLASPRVSRMAATVQDGRARNDLLTWSELNRPRADMSDPARFDAYAYSMVAFLVERYGLKTFGEFLFDFTFEPDWRAAMRSIYQRDPGDVEAQWREDLPRWTAGGWRDNLFAGFDLEPARELIAAGRYAEAQRAVERSQRLFSDLGMTDLEAEAEPLLRQTGQALQAEALMTQTQQALERHAYERAGALLDQAEAQYVAVPAELRPTGLIGQYRELSARGVRAAAKLDSAAVLSDSWRDAPRAREAALAAGSAFADLGDAEMHRQAAALLSDLDERQTRLALILGVLAVLCAAWLALWLWARGPGGLDWGAPR